MRNLGSRFGILLLTGLASVWSPPARAQARRDSPPATQADIERLEKRIDDQQKLIEKLVELQEQYLQALKAALENSSSLRTALGSSTRPAAPDTERPVEPGPAPKTKAAPRKPKKEKLEKPEGFGTVVGKIAGADDAIIYVDDIVAPARGTATMKQEGKRFTPRVLVVTKGTSVVFPNLDAFFHNVFSVSPANSFDLGSYPQGDSRTVKMTRPGVVTVYCNMHPQMVGYVLVVPSSHYVSAGKDGFFRLSNVPVGSHRIVAWAPNAKPISARANVVNGEVVTVELALKKGRVMPHTKKDGLPYGSYER